MHVHYNSDKSGHLTNKDTCVLIREVRLIHVHVSNYFVLPQEIPPPGSYEVSESYTRSQGHWDTSVHALLHTCTCTADEAWY